MIREPWDEFRFHYGVWENRTINLLELGIPDGKKDQFISLWNQVYLIQRKWIQNLTDINQEVRWFEFLNNLSSLDTASYPIEGLGFFKEDSEHTKHSADIELNEEERTRIGETLNGLKNESEKLFYGLEIQTLHRDEFPTSTEEISKLALEPARRYLSIYKKWEDLEQKRFLREFILFPKAWNEKEFITLNQSSDFQIALEDKEKLSSKIKVLETKLKICLQTENCTGIEELVLYVRLHSVKESLKKDFYIVPRLSIIESFNISEPKLFPTTVLEEKKRDSVHLYRLSKSNFLRSDDELSFNEWEKDIARIESIQNAKFDIIDFDPYPLKRGNRYFQPTEDMITQSKIHVPKLKQNKVIMEELIPKIYAYHLILKNCTGEIFRFHNQFYPDLKERSEVLGGTVSDEKKSFSFVPFLAASKVKSNYRITANKIALSYRLLKKKETNLSPIGQLKEDFVPSSKIYKKNPYDQEFLFFTDDTVLLRPIYGLSNITWALGATTIGVFTLPWDHGKKLKNGAESMFFSFPELIFLNIRKGYFPYVTQKDLPATYNELQNE